MTASDSLSGLFSLQFRHLVLDCRAGAPLAEPKKFGGCTVGPGLSSASTSLKLYQDHVHRRGADVFRGVGSRFALEHVAGFLLGLGGLAIRGVGGKLTAGPSR